MIKTLAALVVLLGLSTVGTLGSPSLGMGLVVTGALVGALVILFGSCLLVGWIGARRGADPRYLANLDVFRRTGWHCFNPRVRSGGRLAAPGGIAARL